MYDKYIKELYEITEERNRFVDKCDWPMLDKEELILKSDMKYELGGGDCFGIGGVAFTKDIELVKESEVIVDGKDLQDIDNDTSYARFTIIRLKEEFEFSTETYTDLRKIDYVRFHIYPKGYMLRISTAKNREAVRVSKEAISEGISFEKIGHRFIDEYMKLPQVDAVKIIFVTKDSADYMKLRDIAMRCETVTESMNDILKGMTMDCTTCGYKQICDEVDGLRELHNNNIEG